MHWLKKTIFLFTVRKLLILPTAAGAFISTIAVDAHYNQNVLQKVETSLGWLWSGLDKIYAANIPQSHYALFGLGVIVSAASGLAMHIAHAYANRAEEYYEDDGLDDIDQYDYQDNDDTLNRPGGRNF